MSIFHFLLVIKQNMNKWCRCFHKTTKKRISYLYICRCNTGKKSPNHIRSIAILLHCLYSRAPLNMYATFVLDLNWEFEKKKKNKKKQRGIHVTSKKPWFAVLPLLSRQIRYHRLAGGVVGWCEGVVYLKSPGRPNDIGPQLGKPCYPWSR